MHIFIYSFIATLAKEFYLVIQLVQTKKAQLW